MMMVIIIISNNMIMVMIIVMLVIAIAVTASKVSKYRVISGLYFPVFGLNTEIYFVNLRCQSEYRKIRTRNNSVFGYFSRSE